MADNDKKQEILNGISITQARLDMLDEEFRRNNTRLKAELRDLIRAAGRETRISGAEIARAIGSATDQRWIILAKVGISAAEIAAAGEQL